MNPIILGLLIILNFSVSCTRQDDPKQTERHKHKEEVIYTCPMHPQIRQDKPGKCPICHMDLVRTGETEESADKYEASSMPEGHAHFKLSDSRQQLIGVKTGTVEKKPLFKKIEASGRIAFDPELYTAQAEYIEAVGQKERVKNSSIEEVKHSADRMVESAQLRLKVLGLSDQHIRRLLKNGGTGSSLLIPKSGENLWVYAEVFEMDLPLVRQGHETIITGNVLSNRTLKGKVVSVDRVINPETRTAKVRILIEDTKANLRPESYLDVTILSPLGEQTVVPFDSVLDTGKEAWVFVVKDGGLFEPRLITIFERAGDEVAVTSGVVAGEKIVTSANFLIDSESRLKGVGKVEKKTPSCPPGQFWHEQMNHCMDRP